MKKAEILTANNVAIQYEMASLIQRILAFVLDGLVLTVYYFIVLLLISGVSFYDSSLSNVFTYLLFFPVFFFYNLFCEINFNGQTIGKAALGIRVIKLTGETPMLNDYFIRWTYRVIDIWLCAGALAAIFISSSDKGQRLGDISANTTLIRLNPESKYSIKDILKIGSNKSYEPTYHQVVRMNDEDMLLIKNTLDTIKKKPNPENKKVALELVKKSAELLQIEEIPKNKTQFLTTLLKDYIVLTR